MRNILGGMGAVTLIVAGTLGGCASERAELINLTDTPIVIDQPISGEQPATRWVLPASGTLEVACKDLRTGRATNDEGSYLFDTNPTRHDAECQYICPRSKKVQLLVDNQGMYPVPLKYQQDWEDHLLEIQQQAMSLADQQASYDPYEYQLAPIQPVTPATSTRLSAR